MAPQTLSERLLALWLRLEGVICASSLVAVVMPRSWHVAAHAWLGLGEFPSAPIAEYLARGMSGMCGLYGLLLLWLARDVRVYRGLIGFQAAALIAISTAATLAMLEGGMPSWWLVGDVGSIWASGLIVFALLWASRRGDDDALSGG